MDPQLRPLVVARTEQTPGEGKRLPLRAGKHDEADEPEARKRLEHLDRHVVATDGVERAVVLQEKRCLQWVQAPHTEAAEGARAGPAEICVAAPHGRDRRCLLLHVVDSRPRVDEAHLKGAV